MLGDGESALDAQDAYTTQMCACADVACGMTVQEEHAQWLVDHAMDYAAAGAADGERLTASLEQMEGCLRGLGEAHSAGAGGASAPEPATATDDAAEEAPPEDDGGAGANDENAGGRHSTSGTAAGGHRGKGKGKGKRKR